MKNLHNLIDSGLYFTGKIIFYITLVLIGYFFGLLFID